MLEVRVCLGHVWFRISVRGCNLPLQSDAIHINFVSVILYCLGCVPIMMYLVLFAFYKCIYLSF